MCSSVYWGAGGSDSVHWGFVGCTGALRGAVRCWGIWCPLEIYRHTLALTNCQKGSTRDIGNFTPSLISFFESRSFCMNGHSKLKHPSIFRSACSAFNC